jgi:hypothetical protein
MHFLTDFDNQTKLLHVGYSVLGMLVSMVVLVKFKPALKPRMIIAVILGFVLVYCLTTTGNSERVQNITSIGWFVLGLLFGIGRGEFVIEYLACRFFGAGDPKDDQEDFQGTAEKQLEPEPSPSENSPQSENSIQSENSSQSEGSAQSESSAQSVSITVNKPE